MIAPGSIAAAAAALAIRLAAAAEPPRAPALGSCQECHLALGGELAKPAQAFQADVHAQPGLGCTACHGGDATAADPEAAMGRAKGFRGVPARQDIPKLCGGCHADADTVKRYDPNLATDQLAQYATSQHAKQLAKENARAAVCTSCHDAHGILSPKDARAPVYATRVVETCARCHARPGGGGPVELYQSSVHYAAVTRGDLSAPTCNRCHGSHGATPPGVRSVSAVCGRCHPQNTELFRGSPHQAAFDAVGLGACEACHGNHAVVRPTDAWIGLGEGTVCGRCHTREDPGGEAAAAMSASLAEATALLAQAESQVDAARVRGMLMVDAQLALQEGRQQIIQARTLVHTAAAGPLEERTGAAAAAARRALEEARRAFTEIRYRRTGLLVALLLILVAIVALALEIRRVDAARRSSRDGHG